MALMHTLTDNFDDNSQGALWNSSYANTGTTKEEKNGSVYLTPATSSVAAAYAGYYSTSSYDLTNSYAKINILNLPDQSTTALFYFNLAIDANSLLQFSIEQGWLIARKVVSGAVSTVDQIELDTTEMAWLRIRSADGSVYWEYSTNGLDWTVLTSTPNPITITALFAEVGAGTYESVASPGYARFDSFNIDVTESNIATEFRYAIYKDGVYQSDLPKPSSEFTYSQDIDSAGAQLEIEIPRNFIDVGAANNDTYLVDEAGNQIVDEQGNFIITKNDLVFNDIPIDLNNEIKVYKKSSRYPKGRLVFNGFISKWTADFKNNSIKITVLSYGVELINYVPVTPTNDLTYDAGVVLETADAPHELLPGRESTLPNLVAMETDLTYVFDYPFTMLGFLMSIDVPTKKSRISWGLYRGTPDAPGDLLETGKFQVKNSTRDYYYVPCKSNLPVSAEFYFVQLWNSGESGPDWGRVYVWGQTGDPAADGQLWTNDNAGGGWVATTEDMYLEIHTDPVIGTVGAEFDSYDPANIIKTLVDNIQLQGSRIGYTSHSIDPAAAEVYYRFRADTTLEGVVKAHELSPDGFYWYCDVATNNIEFHDRANASQHNLVMGRHFSNAQFMYSMEQLKNFAYFSGGDTGSGENLFSQYSHLNSIFKYGQWLDAISDNRVTVQETADAIGTSTIARNSQPIFIITMDVLAEKYPIDTLKLGQIVQTRGMGSLIDNLLLQIVNTTPHADYVSITLGNLKPRFSEEYEKTQRRLNKIETIDNPDSPT